MISNQNMCIQTRRKIIMKKKLFGLLAAVMAVSMTTSAFAADTGIRGIYDALGDNSGTFSANDVYLINKLVNSPDADQLGIDVNGDGVFAVDDIHLLYHLALRPNEVQQNNAIKIVASGAFNKTISDAILPEHVNADTPSGKDDYGTATYLLTDKEGSIKDVIDDVISTATPAGLTTQLDKIYFKNAKDVDVYLRHDDGWSMLCYALRYIAPMHEKDAQTCFKYDELSKSGYKFYESAEATNKERTDALDKIKAVVVSEGEITQEGIDTIKANYSIAVPDLTYKEVENTAVEVMAIVDGKYDITANGETLTSKTIAGSDFLAKVKKVKAYTKESVAKANSVFGDTITLTAKNRTVEGDGTTVVISFVGDKLAYVVKAQ